MAISRLFTEHPASVGESYVQHMRHAAGFATRMMLCGVACMIHAALPFLFVRTGSRLVVELNERMVLSRASCTPSPETDEGSPISHSRDSS